MLEACQYLALFDDIATAAGKNLTTASFTKAGYALKNADIPGIGVVSFGPNQPYATGPVTIYQVQPHERDARSCVKLGRSDPDRRHPRVQSHRAC